MPGSKSATNVTNTSSTLVTAVAPTPGSRPPPSGRRRCPHRPGPDSSGPGRLSSPLSKPPCGRTADGGAARPEPGSARRHPDPVLHPRVPPGPEVIDTGSRPTLAEDFRR